MAMSAYSAKANDQPGVMISMSSFRKSKASADVDSAAKLFTLE